MSTGSRSRYSTVRVDAARVWIVDDLWPRSVTNDADRVCSEVNSRFPGRRIIYRDSTGNWDEMVHDNGRFVEFRPARDEPPPMPHLGIVGLDEDADTVKGERQMATFVNAQEMNRLHPVTFQVPSAEELGSIRAGSYVKICAQGNGGDVPAERFWVCVIGTSTEGGSERLVGLVNNDLLFTDHHGLKDRDRVVFGTEHVYAVEDSPRKTSAEEIETPLKTDNGRRGGLGFLDGFYAGGDARDAAVFSALPETAVYDPPKTFEHGKWHNVASVPKSCDDGSPCRIEESRMPARFYRLVIEDSRDSIGRPCKGTSFSTGSGSEAGRLIVQMAVAVSSGMLSWDGKREKQ